MQVRDFLPISTWATLDDLKQVKFSREHQGDLPPVFHTPLYEPIEHGPYYAPTATKRRQYAGQAKKSTHERGYAHRYIYTVAGGR